MATRPHYQAPGYMPQSMSSGGTYPTSIAQRIMKLVILRIFVVFQMTSEVESFKRFLFSSCFRVIQVEDRREVVVLASPEVYIGLLTWSRRD